MILLFLIFITDTVDTVPFPKEELDPLKVFQFGQEIPKDIYVFTPHNFKKIQAYFGTLFNTSGIIQNSLGNFGVKGIYDRRNNYLFANPEISFWKFSYPDTFFQCNYFYGWKDKQDLHSANLSLYSPIRKGNLLIFINGENKILYYKDISAQSFLKEEIFYRYAGLGGILNSGTFYRSILTPYIYFFLTPHLSSVLIPKIAYDIKGKKFLPQIFFRFLPGRFFKLDLKYIHLPWIYTFPESVLDTLFPFFPAQIQYSLKKGELRTFSIKTMGEIKNFRWKIIWKKDLSINKPFWIRGDTLYEWIMESPLNSIDILNIENSLKGRFWTIQIGLVKTFDDKIFYQDRYWGSLSLKLKRVLLGYRIFSFSPFTHWINNFYLNLRMFDNLYLSLFFRYTSQDIEFYRDYFFSKEFAIGFVYKEL